MPALRICCAFLCLQLGATSFHDSEVALVQELSQVRNAQLLADDEDATAEKPAAKAKNAPLQKTQHSADRAGVKSNMTTDVVAADEEEAMKLYNMKDTTKKGIPMAIGGFPMYGCIYNVTPDPALLKLHAPGVLFRYAARPEAIVPHAIARWGLRVAGWDTGLGWIKMPGWQHRYLPLKIDGKPVMRCTDDWSPGTYGGFGGGTMAYTDSNMRTTGVGKEVPVKVLRKGHTNGTYDVRVTMAGIPEYDVPDVPDAYLNPPPTPIAGQYADPEEPVGTNITLSVKEPIAGYPTISVTLLSTEPMKVLFDKVCEAAMYRRGFVCEKRSTFQTPTKKVEENVFPVTTIYGSDTAADLNLESGDLITWYRFERPPVPEPL